MSSPPPSKKSKLASDNAKPTTSTAKTSKNNFLAQFNQSRLETADSILDFDFKKKRVRILSQCENVKEHSGGILYWMSRDRRVQDNWAFLFAQKLALKNHVPLHVCFCLVPNFLLGTLRHYKFMLPGLELVEKQCKDLNIRFHLLFGEAATQVPDFVQKHDIGGVVCDFSPLRIKLKWLNIIKKNLPKDVPLCQVDAHNIVPAWVTSDKQEYSARTIRLKINKHLDTFLTEFPPLIKHPHNAKGNHPKIDWQEAFDFLEIDESVGEVSTCQPAEQIQK